MPRKAKSAQDFIKDTKTALLDEPLPTVKEADEDMKGAVEVGDIESVNDSTGTDIYPLVSALEKKFKGKYAFAFVNRMVVRIPTYGWKMIRVIDHDRFKFVKTSDEANRTTDNILCVREWEVHLRAIAPDENARKRSNYLQKVESTPEGQAHLMNKLNPFKGVTATALPRTE